MSCGWLEILLTQFTAAADVLGFRIKARRTETATWEHVGTRGNTWERGNEGAVLGFIRIHGNIMYPLVMTNIAMENGSFIDDFTSYKLPFMRDFPWLC